MAYYHHKTDLDKEKIKDIHCPECESESIGAIRLLDKIIFFCNDCNNRWCSNLNKYIKKDDKNGNTTGI